MFLGSLANMAVSGDTQVSQLGVAQISFNEHVYEYFLLRSGVRESAEVELVDFYSTLERYSLESARIRIFKRFCLVQYPFRALKFYLHMISIIQVIVVVVYAL